MKVIFALTTLLLSFILFNTNVEMTEGKGGTEKFADSLVRDRRDSYGGGYGSYGGGGGYGGSSYGCSCPTTHCKQDNTDDLLAFGIGALLGLLLAMLRGSMMMMMMPAPAPMGRRSALEDSLNNVTWKVEVSKDDELPFQTGRRSSLLQMLHLPENVGDDLAPFVTNLLQIYTRGSKRPECLRRWVCEHTQQLHRNGGLQARLGSLSSIAFGWYTKDIVPILQNILPGTREVDCRLLSPRCDTSFESND